MLRAGNWDTFGHVDTLSSGLVVIQRVLVVVQTHEGQLVQGYLQGSVIVQGIDLVAPVPLHVGKKRARHRYNVQSAGPGKLDSGKTQKDVRKD